MKREPDIVATIKKSIIDKHGKNAVMLDMRGLVSYTDYFVITSGESETQVRAIAEEVIGNIKAGGLPAAHVEGRSEDGWIIIDCGEVLVHIFLPETRDFYELEKMWSDAPSQTFEETPLP